MEKKQTLEEAAILNCQSITHPYCDREKLMFIKGAKWQEERMYSKDEVLNLLIDMNSWPTTFEGEEDITEWFEQFKTKQP
jgi:hypothetical protein